MSLHPPGIPQLPVDPEVVCSSGKPGSLELSGGTESHIQVANSVNPCVISNLSRPPCDLKTVHINYLRIGIFLVPMISLHKTLLKSLLIVLQFVLFAFPLEVPASDTSLDVVGHSHTLLLTHTWVSCLGYPGIMFLMDRCKLMPSDVCGLCCALGSGRGMICVPLGDGKTAIVISSSQKGHNWLEITKRAVD